MQDGCSSAVLVVFEWMVGRRIQGSHTVNYLVDLAIRRRFRFCAQPLNT